jgi:ParB/RepB/Spo0J family partition protein
MIEMAAIDLRLEYTRSKDTDRERRLLTSIMQQDIMEPLLVSQCKQQGTYILNDGFKRYRCAKKLNRKIIPAESIADDVAAGVVSLLRRQQSRALNIMEQAALLEHLHQKQEMSIYTIAQRLEHSPSWVSMRLNILGQMSESVRSKIMSGQFPARAYLYEIKKFTRVNGVSMQRVDAFVEAVSGKGLSTRQLGLLSRAYFAGSALIERLVGEGDVHRALDILRDNQNGPPADAMDERQRLFVKELKSINRQMAQLSNKALEILPCTAVWMEQINQWSGAVIQQLEPFNKSIMGLYDRSRATGSGIDTIPPGGKSQINSAAVACGRKDGASDTAQRQCAPTTTAH